MVCNDNSTDDTKSLVQLSLKNGKPNPTMIIKVGM